MMSTKCHMSKNNIWFYLISIVIFFYCAMGWQGTAGYNSSAKSAHESKMAMMLSHWRFRVLMLVVLIVPLCLRTYMRHPDYAEASTAFKTQVAAVAPDDLKGRENVTNPDDLKRIEALQSQAKGPLFMGVVFPKILLGLMCAAMLGAFISTHDTYLHSWGSMFIQDVVLPFRKKPLLASSLFFPHTSRSPLEARYFHRESSSCRRCKTEGVEFPLRPVYQIHLKHR